MLLDVSASLTWTDQYGRKAFSDCSVIKLIIKRWSEHLANVGASTRAFVGMVGELEGKRLLGR
jgi:hypothetical protein